jgi:oligoribonuclease NrnB/cAMP/cGMP phosphodiesterase (DHH superfamily)
MKPIIIIGMHRSGTSLLTKILSQLGVFVGNDIDDNNESLFFCKLNDWAMFQAGATWDNPYNMQFLTEKFIAEISSNFKKQLESNATKKYNSKFKNLVNSNDFWAWKDPRNTFTNKIWNKIYPNAKMIHIYRNPIDVAESLRIREEQFQDLRGTQTNTGIKKKIKEKLLINKRLYSQSLRVNSIEEGVKLWAQYTAKAISLEENIIHISYEKMLEKPEEIISQICNFIALKTDNLSLKKVLAGIDSSRKYAFLSNQELVGKYNLIKNNSLVQKLGYDKI